MDDPYSARYHFTPPANWMNDPNGLVYYKGEYHLFYQYHPESDLWGPMHWGHAVSPDLVHWEHLPIALFPDENGMIFSGSAVEDKNNTAGFGMEALVAIFTHHQDGRQSQSLAYSTDSGRTWTKYPANPVLSAPNDTPDFRDPKVIWYGEKENGHWVMCLAVRDRISFYASPDLIHWTHSGDFGPGYGSTAGVWETPELFELLLGSEETRWVLVVGVQDGSPVGGSGTQYFIGKFDGSVFTSENPPETVLWADYGADYYAAQCWNNEPNGRRLMIAWMNNWKYAWFIPSSGRRGVFSLIHELSLARTQHGIRLVHKPIPELQKLRDKHFHWQDETLQPGINLLSEARGESLEIIAEFSLTQETGVFGFRVRVGEDEHTEIRYEAKDQKLVVDRARSGRVDFHEEFGRIHSVNLTPTGDSLRLNIFVDSTSVEVFANGGSVVFTESIFPSRESQGLELFTEGGNLLLKSLDIFHLHPATFQMQGSRP